MTYRQWLKNTYKGSDTPQEDLLNDIEGDSDFPECNSKKKILNHFEMNHACGDCIRIFIRTWYEYKAETEIERLGY